MPKLYWDVDEAYPVFSLGTDKEDGYRFYDKNPPPPIELSAEEVERFRRAEQEWNEVQELVAQRSGWDALTTDHWKASR